MAKSTDNKALQNLLALTEERYDRLLNVLKYESINLQDFLDYSLNEAIELTKSKIGYIYFYSENKKQFILNSWSRDVMKECNITNAQTTYDLKKTGIWGEAVRQRKPIVLNDYKAPNPLKKGYPKGHAQLYKYMTIPVFHNKEIVAVVACANKETNYTDDDVKQLELFMAAVWLIVEQKKLQNELKAKTAELEKTNSFLIGREAKMVALKEEIEKLKK